MHLCSWTGLLYTSIAPLLARTNPYGRGALLFSPRSVVTSITALFLAAVGCPAQDLQLTDLPFTLRDPTTVRLPDAVSEPVAFGMDADGFLILADFYSHALVKLAPDGSPVWEVGGTGDGPGEFQLPYRLAVDADGRIYVYDLRRNDVSVFEPDGTFLLRKQLPLRLRQLNSLVRLGDKLVVVGVGSPSSPGTGNSIHVFSDSLDYRGSFGDLPAVEDSTVLQFWGAGPAAALTADTIAFALSYPYRLDLYTPSGQLLTKHLITSPFIGRPDDAFDIQYEPTFRISDSDKSVSKVTSVVPFSRSYVLLAHTLDGKYIWTVIDLQTSQIFYQELPETWRGPIGYDVRRSVLWFWKKSGYEPQLVKANVEFTAP